MDDEIPLFEISWGVDDIHNVIDSVGRGSYWAKGPYVTEFESKIEEYVGVEHALTVNSGTTALVTALEACDIGPGDEVLVPSFSFIATANVVELVGATPIFVDIERETFGIDPDAVRDRISTETAGIIAVHPYGAPCKIDEIAAIAAEHDVALVEDAAAAFGATFDGQRVGTFGDAAAFSFCQNKIVSTGEGGAVVTDEDELASEAKRYRSHGRVSEDYFDSADSGRYVSLGSNYRMPDIVASLGCSQTEKVQTLIAGRRSAAARMAAGLSDVDGVTVHTGIEETDHVYQLFTVTLDPDIDRAALTESLGERGIASKVYWSPIHESELYQDRYEFEDDAYPVTQDVSARVLSLPIHPELSTDEADRIVDAVADAVRKQRETGSPQ